MPDRYDTQDDNPNAGTNSAPAQIPVTPDSSDPGARQSGGQLPTKANLPNNPDSTDLRRWNPLSKLSSYTYSLTLYMLTPEAANYFAINSNLPENIADGEYFIVAQSGGINNDSEPRGLTLNQDGTPGPGRSGYDYYIDDLSMETFLLAQDGQKTGTLSANFNFKVIEPSGFTFLTRLGKLSGVVNERSGLIRNGDIAARPNLYQQHYMIGIRFYGYDKNGNVLNSSQIPDAGMALNDEHALYERLFPLVASKVSTKLTDRSFVYDWECTMVPFQAAFGDIRGKISAQASLEGVTVAEILGSSEIQNTKSLMGWLNSQQQDQKNQKKIGRIQTYNIRWVETDVLDSTAIASSLLITDPDYSKETSAMTQAQSSKDVTVAESIKTGSINTRSKTVNVPAGTSIVAAIDQIIVHSQYVVDTLMKEINSRIESETRDNPKGKLKWYAIKPVVLCKGRDKVTMDWVYDITFEIAPYEVPYVKNQYVTARSKYYGPVKRYDYLFTGQNTEVINFEMEYNNLFYVITPESVTSDTSSESNTLANIVPRAPKGNVDSNPTMGNLNRGGSIAEAARASVYSVADQSIVTMKIVGDPDFLMDSIGTKFQSGSFSKFYGKNNTINPYGGQVFVEVIFKTAEDYKNNGLFDVDLNQTIGFYPIETQKLIGNSGIIYKISKVESTFSRGKFEQVLHMYMVHPNELIIPDASEISSNASRNARDQFNVFERNFENYGGMNSSDNKEKFLRSERNYQNYGQYPSGQRSNPLQQNIEQANVRKIDNAIEASDPSLRNKKAYMTNTTANDDAGAEKPYIGYRF